MALKSGTHSPQGRLVFTCRKCGKQFRGVAGARYHMRHSCPFRSTRPTAA